MAPSSSIFLCLQNHRHNRSNQLILLLVCWFCIGFAINLSEVAAFDTTRIETVLLSALDTNTTSDVEVSSFRELLSFFPMIIISTMLIFFALSMIMLGAIDVGRYLARKGDENKRRDISYSEAWIRIYDRYSYYVSDDEIRQALYLRYQKGPNFFQLNLLGKLLDLFRQWHPWISLVMPPRTLEMRYMLHQRLLVVSLPLFLYCLWSTLLTQYAVLSNDLNIPQFLAFNAGAFSVTHCWVFVPIMIAGTLPFSFTVNLVFRLTSMGSLKNEAWRYEPIPEGVEQQELVKDRRKSVASGTKVTEFDQEHPLELIDINAPTMDIKELTNVAEAVALGKEIAKQAEATSKPKNTPMAIASTPHIEEMTSRRKAASIFDEVSRFCIYAVHLLVYLFCLAVIVTSFLITIAYPVIKDWSEAGKLELALGNWGFSILFCCIFDILLVQSINGFVLLVTSNLAYLILVLLAKMTPDEFLMIILRRKSAAVVPLNDAKTERPSSAPSTADSTQLHHQGFLSYDQEAHLAYDDDYDEEDGDTEGTHPKSSRASTAATSRGDTTTRQAISEHRRASVEPNQNEYD